MTRAEQATAFLAEFDWGDATIAPLAGDASNRRYDRLVNRDGAAAVLMDAPPEKGEDVRPFVRIAEWLTAQGLSAPRIMAQNAERGFLLIEDLGDRLFAREMASDPASEVPLYTAAVDVLVALYCAEPPALPAYDAATTVPLAALAFDWYLTGATDQNAEPARSIFCAAFSEILTPYDTTLNVLVQRDYHAENLLWLPERTGASRVGLLDFQDAMLGHPAYDLVSILQDARRDVSAQTEARIRQQYVDKTGIDEEAFSQAYAVFGLQRNMRILGVFARLCLRDGKAHYVDLLPRVWGHLQTNLQHPALAVLRPLIEKELPAPDKAIMQRLKDKCGTCAGR